MLKHFANASASLNDQGKFKDTKGYWNYWSADDTRWFYGLCRWCLYLVGSIKIDAELPLGDIKGIVVDQDGTVYLGLGTYGYVQKYSNTGTFIENWKIAHSNGGSFNIDMIDNILIIRIARGDRMVKYSQTGELLEVVAGVDTYNWHDEYEEFTDHAGNTYKVGGLLIKRISKESLNGDYDASFINTGLLRDVLKSPIPSWIIAVLGMYLASPVVLVEKLRVYLVDGDQKEEL